MKKYAIYGLIVVIALFVGVRGGQYLEYTQNQSSKDQDIMVLTDEIQTLRAKVKSLEGQLENSVPVTPTTNVVLEKMTLGAGNYIIGKDIAPGIWDIEWISGFGNVMGSDVNEIFGAGTSGIQVYQNAILNNGEIVEITNDLKVNFIPEQ